MRGFYFYGMMKRCLLASFVGGLMGACCVLMVVYVTNTKALVIDSNVDSAVNALHSRINDFYIFAGIVITLLLAINVGVFVNADDEVDKQIKGRFEKYEEEIKKTDQ